MEYTVDYMDSDGKTRTLRVNPTHEQFIPKLVKAKDKRFARIIRTMPPIQQGAEGKQ